MTKEEAVKLLRDGALCQLHRAQIANLIEQQAGDIEALKHRLNSLRFVMTQAESALHNALAEDGMPK